MCPHQAAQKQKQRKQRAAEVKCLCAKDLPNVISRDLRAN
jgi:hypothetical protein